MMPCFPAYNSSVVIQLLFLERPPTVVPGKTVLHTSCSHCSRWLYDLLPPLSRTASRYNKKFPQLSSATCSYNMIYYLKYCVAVLCSAVLLEVAANC